MSWVVFHERAQKLSSDAQLKHAAGQRAASRALFAQAADLEVEAFSVVERTRVRTRSITAVSAAALLFKAKRLNDAERFLFKALADDDILSPQRKQLRELLESVSDEMALPHGASYSGEEIWVSLRGGDVGQGTAPLELALMKSAEVGHLLMRVAEWQRGDSFRVRGPGPRDLRSLVQARATQPSVGSYRFAVRLVEPEQLDLGLVPSVDGRVVAESLFALISAACSQGAEAAERVRTLVPEPPYRQALLKLLRNVIPNDRTLREVELTHVSRSTEKGEEPQKQAIRLIAELRTGVADILRSESPQTTEERVTTRGTLRALHLDANWLLVIDDDGASHRFEAKDDVLDDVVGPMVNRRVVVRARWVTSTTKRSLRLDDIDLDTDT